LFSIGASAGSHRYRYFSARLVVTARNRNAMLQRSKAGEPNSTNRHWRQREHRVTIYLIL